MKTTDTYILFAKQAKYTNWGLLGSSRSMYAGGYDFFVYGIKGFFNLIVDRRWGAFCGGGRR